MPETLFFESPQDTFQLRDSKMTDIPVSFALKLGEAMLYDVIFSYVYASTFWAPPLPSKHTRTVVLPQLCKKTSFFIVLLEHRELSDGEEIIPEYRKKLLINALELAYFPNNNTNNMMISC